MGKNKKHGDVGGMTPEPLLRGELSMDDAKILQGDHYHRKTAELRGRDGNHIDGRSPFASLGDGNDGIDQQIDNDADKL